MSALALLALNAPSLRAVDTPRAAGHVTTIDRLARAPCDTRMRERRDPVSPESLRPSCTLVVRPRQRGKALEPLGCLAGHDVVALEGPGSCSATTIHGDSGRHNDHRHGSVTDDHQRLAAASSHPDGRAVLPRMPAPMVQPDGTQQHEGERHAATRFSTTLRQDHPPLQCLMTADALSAKAPPLATRHDDGCHDRLGVNEGDPADVFTPVQAAEAAGRLTDDARPDRAAGLVPRVRVVTDLPLHGSSAAVRVHGLESWEMGQDQGPHGSGVTDLRVKKRHVDTRMRGGRARWQIDHETVNTRKNHGDHGAHHDGPGAKHRSVGLALLLRWAFVVAQTPPRCGAVFQAVWAKLGRQRQWWERRRSLCDPDERPSMRQRCEALVYGLTRPQPICVLDAPAWQAFLDACVARTARDPSAVGKVRPDHDLMPCSTRHVALSDSKHPCLRATWMATRLNTHALKLMSEAIGPSAGMAAGSQAQPSRVGGKRVVVARILG